MSCHYSPCSCMFLHVCCPSSMAPSLHTDGSGCGVLVLVGGWYFSSLSSLLSSNEGLSSSSSARCNLKSKHYWVLLAGRFSMLLSDLYLIQSFGMATSKKCVFTRDVFCPGWRAVESEHSVTEVYATHVVIIFPDDCWPSHLDIIFVFVGPYAPLDLSLRQWNWFIIKPFCDCQLRLPPNQHHWIPSSFFSPLLVSWQLTLLWNPVLHNDSRSSLLEYPLEAKHPLGCKISIKTWVPVGTDLTIHKTASAPISNLRALNAFFPWQTSKSST